MYRGLPVLLLLPPPLEVVLAGGPTFAAAVSGAADVDVVDVVAVAIVFFLNKITTKKFRIRRLI